MSQAGIKVTASTIGSILTLTGNAGGPVGPDGGGNIDVVGGNAITITGNPGTNTLTVDVTGGTDGQVLIGATAGNPAFATITSTDSSITFTPGANSLNMAVSGSFSDTFTADVGSATPLLGVLNDFGAHGINTLGAGNTLTTAINNTISLGDLADVSLTPSLTLASGDLYFSDPNDGLNPTTLQRILFKANGGSNNIISFFLNNIFIGNNVGNTTMTPGVAIFNIGIGSQSSQSLTTGTRNTSFGNASFIAGTTAQDNALFGYVAGSEITTGNFNVGLGSNVLSHIGGGLKTGSFNIAIGSYQPGSNAAGANYNGAESNNIVLNNPGVLGESNTLRIGLSTGAGSQQLNRSFIAGIYGITPAASAARIPVINSLGQLGTVTQTDGQLLIGSSGVIPVAATITPGTGIAIANGAGSITISATANVIVYVNVNSTPYVVAATDEFLSVDCSGGAITVQLPNAPTTGRIFYVKDRTGNANVAGKNITVTTVGGAVNIDGAATYLMNTQYAAVSIIFNGSTYEIF